MRLPVVLIVLSVLCSPAYSEDRKKSPDEGPEYDLTKTDIDRAKALKIIMRVRPGTPYADLRDRALKAGFKMVRVRPERGRCLPDLSEYCSYYVETISCKAVGGADCRFLMERDGSWFTIDTTGFPGTQRVRQVNWLSLAQKDELASEVGVR